jgi:hypothetical protein
MGRLSGLNNMDFLRRRHEFSYCFWFLHPESSLSALITSFSYNSLRPCVPCSFDIRHYINLSGDTYPGNLDSENETNFRDYRFEQLAGPNRRILTGLQTIPLLLWLDAEAKPWSARPVFIYSGYLVNYTCDCMGGVLFLVH